MVSVVGSSLTYEDITAMQWASMETNPRSTFLVIPGDGRGFVSEWFPAFAQRRSVATFEGTEWLGADAYASTVRDFDSAQGCGSEGAICLDKWEQSTGRLFDYVMVARDLPLAANLTLAYDYQPVYQTAEAMVFEHRRI
jgi:hypothetical protein